MQWKETPKKRYQLTSYFLFYPWDVVTHFRQMQGKSFFATVTYCNSKKIECNLIQYFLSIPVYNVCTVRNNIYTIYIHS